LTGELDGFGVGWRRALLNLFDQRRYGTPTRQRVTPSRDESPPICRSA